MKKKINILPTRENHLGGGTLSKKDYSDGLKKFSKFKKQKKIIVSAIIGLILVVGGITLYRTFALYEEKKEFNVLRGRVPDFSVADSDIILSFLINGEKQSGMPFPSKNSGYSGGNVVCKNNITAKWDYSLWGLVNIENPSNSEKIECTVDFIDLLPLYDSVELGDYVAYTPSNANYRIEKSVTGYGSVQTINPSELDLWRVIRKNTNGTIDIISENVSTADIYFYGANGYINLINGLNIIAKGYETEGITIGSRHMGYSNQTLTCSAYNSGQCATGDTGYEVDTTLVKNAIGTLVSNKADKTSTDYYYLASREISGSPNVFYYKGINNKTDAVIRAGAMYCSSYCSPSSPMTYESTPLPVRPIVTLKSGMTSAKNTMNGKNLWDIN